MWRKGLVVFWVVFFGLGLLAQGRTGAWLDTITFLEVTDGVTAAAMIEAGELHLFAYALTDPELFKKVLAKPEIFEAPPRAYGVYTELTFNPYGPEFNDGRLNPFSVPAIREAMNWLIDRVHICKEIYADLAIPRYLAITPTFPDYARYVDVAKELEVKYAPDPEKAKEVIFAEMEKLGAELVEGKWYYKGGPVEIIMLIRVEDERKDIGDYVATLLEELGFTVRRDYKVSKEAAVCWIKTAPAEGCFHIYTGGWVTTIISRDQGGNFSFFYTPRGLPLPLWMAYKPDPEFDKVAERLEYGVYKDMPERRELFAKALELSMKDSVRAWLANESPYFMMSKGLKATSDLAGGVYGAWSWAFTIHWVDEVGNPIPGGAAKIGVVDFLIEPWNPIAGTNWIYDMMPIRSTGEWVAMPDPFTGLFLPQRLKKAEVYVLEGLPVGKTLDWLTLEFVPEIKVPEDAWIDWDPATGKVITVGEKYPEGLTAKAKVRGYFSPDYFKLPLHDGTTLQIEDVIMPFLMTFARGREDSPLFDEAYKPDFDTFVEYFRGIRIVQEDPLIVEYYSDAIYLDAEWFAYSYMTAFDIMYLQGPAPWHTLAIANLAEMDAKIAYSEGKADKLGVEWTNFLAGPSLDILKEYLEKAVAEKYIPFKEVLGKWITPEEAVARYEALKKWFGEKGHFWVGIGPFYVEKVDPVAGILVLKRFELQPDPAEKWLIFAEPKLAEVEAIGPKVLTIGMGAVIPVNITFKGEPYPPEEIEFVKFLVFDAEGNLVKVGEAEYLAGPTWEAVLTSADTAKLVEGTSRLLAVVSSKVVAIPSFDEIVFVAVP